MATSNYLTRQQQIGRLFRVPFCKTPVRIIDITESMTTVKYKCNGKTRKFFNSLFDSYPKTEIEETQS